MEPIEWFIGVLLFAGGVELWDQSKEKPEVKAGVVNTESTENKASDTVLFSRGQYFYTEDGYFISDLSLAPQDPKNIEGCQLALLAADLSMPLKKNKKLEVKKVNLGCEASFNG